MTSGVRHAPIDTIVAPATPVGRSALAIVRIDGPRSSDILRSLSGAVPDVRLAILTYLRHGDETLDEVIAIRYAAPHSFTGNDLVELTLHGSPAVIDRVIRAVVDLGARPALPGEFTERAVLNGKIDLVQAESIADLINSRTALQAKISLANLRGVLSSKAAEIRESLLYVISRLEAALDFSEEGYHFISDEDVRVALESAIVATRSLADTHRRGQATVEGLTAVILGRPNAGKSTLLNRLVGSDRAIVTPIPGTTRDMIRETVEIGGLPVTFVDTAGLRTSGDLVEGIGMERARDAARHADIVLYLVDASSGVVPEDARELQQFPAAMVVHTKIDLAPAPAGQSGISVTEEMGVDELLAHLDQRVRNSFAAPEGSLVNERQRLAVARCEEALRAAVRSVEEHHDEQYVLVDLHRAGAALGELTGAITNDEVLAEIFSKFCIGK